MSDLFSPEVYLNRAEKEYLFEGLEEFTYLLRLSKAARDNPVVLEREISKAGFHVSASKDRKVSLVKISAPSELKFDLKLLLRSRPGLRKIRKTFVEATEASSVIDVASFLRKNPAECRKKFGKIVAAVKTADFLIKNKGAISGYFPRQIPHGQSTKLLMEDTLTRRILAFHLGRPQISENELCDAFGLRQKPSYFHFYASKIQFDGHQLSNYNGVITEANISRFDFSCLTRVLIIENEESFYGVHDTLPETLVLLGNGNKAANLTFLKNSLSTLQVFYWGDIDKKGYEILNAVGDIFAHLMPILMDHAVIDQFGYLHQEVEVEASNRTLRLHDTEYKLVCAKGLQIEQEQLPPELCTKAIIGTSLT